MEFHNLHELSRKMQDLFVHGTQLEQSKSTSFLNTGINLVSMFAKKLEEIIRVKIWAK